MLSVRGRCQVGKSRLFSEVIARSKLPSIYFTAVKNASTSQQIYRFTQDAAESAIKLPGAEEVLNPPARNWAELFSQLAFVSSSTPSIIVIDEFPWAVEQDPTLEGTLQNSWDRLLEKNPVLLVLIGSDIAMMERLSAHDRPLFGRSQALVVNPLNPYECQDFLMNNSPGTHLEPNAVDVLDSYLVTGGYPRLLHDRSEYDSADSYVKAQLRDSLSPLVTTAQLTLAAEFPHNSQTQQIIFAMGSNIVGEVNFSRILDALNTADSSMKTAVVRSLKILQNKRLLSIEKPFGAKQSSKLTRYAIADSYLHLWLRFIYPHLANLARGNNDLVINYYRNNWTTCRGLWIEPVIRESMWKILAHDDRINTVEEIGSWWNRTNNHEYDIVAGSVKNTVIEVVGSIKWRENRKFDNRDYRELVTAKTVIPGAQNALTVAVCPAGIADTVPVDMIITPVDIIHAWKPR